MADSASTDSPLHAAAGAAGPQTTEAFELLGNKTRLAILLALWEFYDPNSQDNPVTFSELRERVGMSHSGQFNYHLGKLEGQFVEATDEGYELRNAGQKIVQAVIAGSGLDEASLDWTEVDALCPQCGAQLGVHYQNQHLRLQCSECNGRFGSEHLIDNPRGTIASWGFYPAGLPGRTPEEIFVAGTIACLESIRSRIRGVCPKCYGTVDETLQICTNHKTATGDVCPTCGTPDEARAFYVCSVCKSRGTFPAEMAVYDHPRVRGFCYDHGIELTYNLEDPEACGRLWNHLYEREHAIVSTDPVHVQVSVPGRDETLQLTLDQELEVIETSVVETSSAK